MRKFKRLTLTLALLIAAVGGAWAQTAFGVKEITADMLPASWSTDESAVTADDLAKLGFMEVTEDEAKTWTGAPQQGTVRLIYTLCESVNWVDGGGGYSTSSYTRKIFYSCLNGQKIFITTELTEWSLTPDTDKKVWTLAKMPANDIELQVEYEPTKVTMAVNDKTMGTAEVCGESKVEWTADTWKGWTSDTKTYTVDDITMTSTQSAYIQEITEAGDNLHSLFFFVNQEDNNSTVTFSSTSDPFSRIEFTMINDYAEDQYFNYRWHGNPTIMPKDNWTFSGKSAVWEGEATKSLTLQSCTTYVSKITFFKGAIPDGVTINTDGTFTVAKTATVTLKATPAEGYKFLYWEDDQTNTNPVREVTIESGMADMTYKAVFAEITYNVTFVEGTDLNEWTATPNPAKTKQTVTVTYTGSKKVIGVKAEKKPVAEGHALTSAKFGEIVCSDGKAYAAADKDILPKGVKAEALVCYVDGDHGLALAMADVKNEKMSWDNDRGANDGKTAAEWCTGWNTSHPITGATWLLASKTQWDNMISAAGSASNLSNAFSAVGGTNLQAWSYWSSTPNHGGSAAWFYYFPSSAWQWTYLNQDSGRYIRACLEW